MTYTDMSTEELWAERRRLAALRDPACMGRYLDPDHFTIRAHTRLIARGVTALGSEYDRLLVTLPPQTGKSTLVSELMPFWRLVQHPRDKIVVASYAASLALKKSRSVRRHIVERGNAYGLELQRGESNIYDWSLTAGGGMRATGVGGSLTGFPANCLAYDSLIETGAGPMTIGAYVESGCTDPVLAYDHDQNQAVWAPVTATSVTERETLEVHTAQGRTVTCTPDHRFYVPGRGYVPAVSLQSGDPLLVGGTGLPTVRPPVPATFLRGSPRPPRGKERNLLLPRVQQRRTQTSVDMQGMRDTRRETDHLVLRAVPDGAPHGDRNLRALSGTFHAATGRSPEAGRPRRTGQAALLLEEVPGGHVRGDARTLLQRVRYPDATDPYALLHPFVQGDEQRAPGETTRTEIRPEAAGTDAPGDHLHDMRTDLRSPFQPHPVLLTPLRQPSTLPLADRHWELPVQQREVLYSLLPQDPPTHPAARPAPLRRLQRAGIVRDVPPQGERSTPLDLPRPPHQSGRGGQPPAESRLAVRHVSRRPPQISYDTVALVRPVRAGTQRVYDLQVEGTHNFFAGEVLVHNCLIVDDPHKDRREADSLRMRERVWEWWSSVALSRLRPGSPVLLTLTRWHEDDLAGRVLAHEGRLDKGGRWKVIHLPAVAVSPDDPLGRMIGDPLTHPALPDTDIAGLRRHWEDKKATSTPRDWGALYMGDPQPSEGALLTRDELAARRAFNRAPVAVRRAVSIDPSGGGRDVAGIVAGFLAEDGGLYITHDRSRPMSSDQWSRKACLLAYETQATMIVYEKNYGRDLVRLAIGTAWSRLQEEGAIPRDALKPYLVDVWGKSGKYLRAEPIAQQWREDRIHTLAYLPELEEEWATWQADHPESPGRIDASVYLAYALLKVPGASDHIGNPAGVSLNQAAQAGGGLGGISLGRGTGLPGR